MISPSPSTVLAINFIVGLMSVGLLLLSSAATRQVRQGMANWVFGDIVASLGRLVLLLQPGVLFTTGLAALQPQTAALLNATLVIVGAGSHTLALRAALAEQDNPRRWAALPFAFSLAYLGGALLLPSHETQLQLLLLFTGSCMVWSVGLAWPRRQRYRGAWLVCGIMAIMLAFAVVSVVGLALAPPLAQGQPRLPPLGVLLLSLVSSLGLTMAFTLIQFERMQQRIEMLSVTDPLTGACNRRGFLQQLAQRWDEARRHGTPLALAILDLDHFKRINDTQGHHAGDAVLVGFVERVRGGIRSSDVLGRWGGEEFVLLMPNTSQEEALVVTERLRAAVAASPLVAGLPVVTVSGGVTGLLNLPAELDQDMLLHQADARLYRAKRQRNCVVASDEAVAA
jgi:diguanylate cyclase (GGDEF)-like protein